MSFRVEGSAADSTTVTGMTAWMAADDDPIRISKAPASVTHACRRTSQNANARGLEANLHGARLTRLEADLRESPQLLVRTLNRCLDITHIDLDDLSSHCAGPCW